MAFLTARWLDLLIFTYEADPDVLEPFLPHGTELRTHDGAALLSVVGFRFEGTRVLQLPPPMARDFEEVNLRFYARRQGPSGWQDGVVFVREIVPHWAVAWIARKSFFEHYVARPMRHRVLHSDGVRPKCVEYWWGDPHHRSSHMRGVASGRLAAPALGSEADFITRNEWGFVRRDARRTYAYRVTHPIWRVQPLTEAVLDCEVTGLFGESFVDSLSGSPRSALLVEGSDVAVHWRQAVA